MPVPAVKLNKLLPKETPEIVLLVNAELGMDVNPAPDPLKPVALKMPVEGTKLSFVELVV